MIYDLEAWCRKVDINPDYLHKSGIDYYGVPWAKHYWRVIYRDFRERARIFCTDLDELVKFRGFGVLKKIWVKNNCVGRIRVNDLRNFNDEKQ